MMGSSAAMPTGLLDASLAGTGSPVLDAALNPTADANAYANLPSTLQAGGARAGVAVPADGSAAPAPTGVADASAPSSAPMISAPGVDPSAAPAAPNPFASLPPPPTRNTNRSLIGDVLDQVLLGGAIRHVQDAQFGQQVDNYGRQFGYAKMQAELSQMSPQQREAYIANPEKFGEEFSKNFAPQTVSGGSTLASFGPGGPTMTAPLLGKDDQSGAFYTQTPGGTYQTGQAGGGFASGPGGSVLSTRTGAIPSVVPDYTTTPGGVTYAKNLPGAPIAHVEPQFQKLAAGGGREVGSFQSPPILGSPAAAAAFPTGPAGGGASQGGGFPAVNGPSGAGGAGAPSRGDRNFNPGNVMPPPQGSWKGQTGVDAAGYAVFGNAADGARAADKNLAAYARDGANTPTAIANRWASSSPANERASKAQAIAQAAGVGPNDKLDLTNPQVRAKVLPAIFNTEGTHVGGQGGATAASGAAQPGSLGGSVTAGYQGPVQGANAPPLMSAPVYNPKTDQMEQTNTATGEVTGKPVAVGFDRAASVRDQVQTNPIYQEAFKAAHASNTLNNLLNTATANNGVMDMGALDTEVQARSGASARVGNVQLLLQHLGLWDELQGHVSKSLANASVTPKTLNDLRSSVNAGSTDSVAMANKVIDNNDKWLQQASGGRQKLGIDHLSLDAEQTPEWMHHGPGAIPRAQGAAAPANATPVRLAGPNAAAAYAQVPSGGLYIAPDGSTRRKR